jgi:hypothetical protein
MVLPVFPNAISTSQMNVELERTNSTTINMNQALVRDLLAGNISSPSTIPFPNLSQISFSNGHGKEAPFRASIVSNINEVNVRNYLISQGWDQVKRVILTINSGVTVSTNSASSVSYALTISGSFPNGIRIVNNGSIIGSGGPGGTGGGRFNTTVATLSGIAGGPGGRGIYADTNVAIINNGTIAGGGGGGGGGAGAYGINSAQGVPRQAWCGAGGGGGGGGFGSAGVAGLNGTSGAGITAIGSSGTDGEAGTLLGGAGGLSGNITASYSGLGILVVAGNQNIGGAGGNRGAAGSSGGEIGSIAGTGTVRGNAGAGGAAGLAIKGSNYVTLWTTGTIVGGTETV